jgi:DNA-directed RNA polymerase specialized sigma24 family protein
VAGDLNKFTSIFDQARSATLAGQQDHAEALWAEIQALLPPLIRPVALAFGLDRERADQDFIPDLLGQLFLVVERFKRHPDKRGRAWVKRIAYNMLVNRTREFRRAASLPDEWEGVLVALVGPAEALSEQEARLALGDAEAKLGAHPPEGNSKIVEVYDRILHQGRTTDQVMAELGLKRASVGVYLSKALTALRGHLVSEGGER